MIITGFRGWLVVRQGLTRRIYGAADAGLVISFATYPLKAPVEKAVVSCNYSGFIFGLRSIRGACVIQANCSGSLGGPTYHVGYPVTWRLLVYGEV